MPPRTSTIVWHPFLQFFILNDEKLNTEFKQNIVGFILKDLGQWYLIYFVGSNVNKSFADLKSSYLYKNLPVQTKKAILSRRPILLAILLYEQFIHLTRINLRPNTQFLSTQQCAYQSLFGYSLV